MFAVALAATLAVTVLPFIPDGGPRELYDRTVGYQAGRGSPFSVWGQTDLGLAADAVKVAAVGLALLVAFVPRRAGDRQVAALGAAVLIALQLPVNHWFYLYVVWFLPFVLVALGARGTQQLADGGGAPMRVALDEHGVQPRILVRRLEAHLRQLQEALDRELALDADHAIRAGRSSRRR